MNAIILDIYGDPVGLREASGGVVSFEVNEYKVEGMQGWRMIRFNAEHDLGLVFVHLDDGSKVAYIGYGPGVYKHVPENGAWKTWEDLFTAEEIWGLASENENYDDSKVDEIMDILRPLIFV
jgi:hypothetical protein